VTTKLEAINQMLASIGQAPVVSLDTANPEISLASSILDTSTRQVLGEGWHFNTEVKFPFVTDNDGFITVPDSILQISDNKFANSQKYQTVLREGKLYDKINHTFEFPVGATISCDVVWFIQFEELPQVFKDYITQRACRMFAGSVIGSEAMYKFNSQDEALLRANCLAYDTSTSEVNVFGIETGQNFYVSYTPFQTIAR